MKLFETLAINNTKIQNLSYHNQRFVLGQKFLGKSPICIEDCLDDYLNKNINHIKNKSFFKAKVIYDLHQIEVLFEDYVPKKINSFLMIGCDTIEYRHKYHNRTLLNHLLSQQGDCDEIIIIKQGFVSDCTIGNLLFLKNGVWYTPDTPLLKGTQRAFLLDSGCVQERRIFGNQVFDYEKIMMVNALNPFEKSCMLDIDKIKVSNEQNLL